MDTRRAKRQAVPAGVEERWAEIDGKRIRYLRAGSGQPLLLVHGLMGYSFSWTENMVELGKHYSVYAPDLLNTGLSDRVEQDGTLEVAARSLLAFMDAVGINQTHVVGSSHGGTLVMVAGALAPERFHHIVAVSPANGISEQSRWQAT
ncbi:MAG TPA: alpha/beta fold hydrolase, partial [Terriglobales bacterium]|nr:alpha/beta fold hydrolase [Terriglobales bacterium]